MEGLSPPFLCLNPCRLNGSLPKGVEAQNRTLFFRGPITYSVAGTYVCEATNPIGTRSGQVEVNITGRKLYPAPAFPSLPSSGFCHRGKCVSPSTFSPLGFYLELWPLVLLCFLSSLFKGSV